MAQQPANLVSPTASYYQQPSYAQGQFTPSAGTTPPSNTVSPTNQISHLHTRQLHQPRQPMYIPAALRQTELPSRHRRPDTPPRSANSSLDSTHKFPVVGPSLPVSPVDEDGPGSFAGINRFLSEELNEEAFGSVTGPPTKNHWKVSDISLLFPVPALLCSVLSCPARLIRIRCLALFLCACNCSEAESGCPRER